MNKPFIFYSLFSPIKKCGQDTLPSSSSCHFELADFGNTRKALFRLTKRGNKHFGILQDQGNKSLVHSYWKSFYAKRFKEAGYRVVEETERYSGRMMF